MLEFIPLYGIRSSKYMLLSIQIIMLIFIHFDKPKALVSIRKVSNI